VAQVFGTFRIGRSVRNLMAMSSLLQERGVDLVCLDQPIDTISPQGKLFFTILAAFAEFERDLIRERTKNGLAATTARGRNGGRK
jgi:DNA invertase Pin-like site-specific DNA recombinase